MRMTMKLMTIMAPIILSRFTNMVLTAVLYNDDCHCYDYDHHPTYSETRIIKSVKQLVKKTLMKPLPKPSKSKTEAL